MSEKARRLATYVHVGGRRYGPDDDIPDEVAEKITNPNVWAVDGDEPPAGTRAGTPGGDSGVRLAAYVHVGGRRYGPGDVVPDEVAAQITNPKAWEGGELPTFVKDGADADDDSDPPEGEDHETGDEGDGKPPPPPRSGPGSSEKAWREWASHYPELGVDGDARRDDIWDAAENAGLIDPK
ncbi:hypothetical protein ABT336_13350 [Micromonospora sp. NPDC000207]|uniref:hypothetical protein n=1 Tax=Micromonospora sp. NPDC000207 TaxID=3154246 RepID=UPI003321C03F